jgi:hypothetical protein
VQAELAQILSEFDELADDGREKRALDRSCGIAGENGFLDLAERVGFPERVFAKPNVYNDFAIIPFDRNDLPFANHRRRLRPVAGVCRFWRLNGTRNDTRRGILTKFSRRVLARHKELIAL